MHPIRNVEAGFSFHGVEREARHTGSADRSVAMAGHDGRQARGTPPERMVTREEDVRETKNSNLGQALAGAILTIMAASGTVFAEETPTPVTVIARACQASGGVTAFQKMGALRLLVSQDEIATDGTPMKAQKSFLVTTPGPVPGWLEIPKSDVVAGDDGSGGWAVQAGRADPRPMTKIQVKRMLATSLFPVLLPFSLQWAEVHIAGVAPDHYKGRASWKLTIEFPATFFVSPQIATTWTIQVDQQTWGILAASAPATDLGKGIQADGMLFTWSNPVTVNGIRFFGEQRVTGIDDVGREKPHSRIDRIQYQAVPAAEAAKRYISPVPLDPSKLPGMPGAPTTAPRG